MAKVLGESGRYVSQEAVNKRSRTVLVAFVGIAILGVIEGLVLSTFVPLGAFGSLLRLFLLLAALAGIFLVYRVGSRKMDALEKGRVAMMRGAAGETLVGSKLANFLDEFCVINDLTTPFGNLDHVVVGPTGVFVLDSKNWRGVVSADGNGELLLNGQPTDKPLVRLFIVRVMNIRDKVRTLATGLYPFYQSVFVFTAARVEAKWGTTGKVHCITDDQLHDYIVEKDFGQRLKPEEVQLITQAFLGLAHMDREFARGENNKPL
ncbi:MAG: NERD domain-containing protein [Verrucomicrobia bacterium]|nr:MAG: NERD domain-containing protein [Verrucomicrobiota bacterium]